jgi:hypothetical protein
MAMDLGKVLLGLGVKLVEVAGTSDKRLSIRFETMKPGMDPSEAEGLLRNVLKAPSTTDFIHPDEAAIRRGPGRD